MPCGIAKMASYASKSCASDMIMKNPRSPHLTVALASISIRALLQRGLQCLQWTLAGLSVLNAHIPAVQPQQANVHARLNYNARHRPNQSRGPWPAASRGLRWRQTSRASAWRSIGMGLRQLLAAPQVGFSQAARAPAGQRGRGAGTLL